MRATRIGPDLTSTLFLADPVATDRLGRGLAPRLGPGDTVALAGGLGAGKSHLARAMIHARLAAAGRTEDVPSPSYTLVQIYQIGPVEVWHVDLYRLADTGEIAELGLDAAFAEAICLVEWADRLGPALPARHLAIGLDFDPASETARRATLTARGPGWDWLPGVLDRAP